jgi:3-carboxymuconate cyclase
MKWLTAIFLLVSVMSASCESLRFYIGTYTGNTGSRGIYSGLLDADTGALHGIDLAAEAVNPSFLAVAPDGRTLYAAVEAASGAVGAFRVGENGRLTALNTVPSGGAGACHVSVDRAGRHVFVANYGGGNVSALAVEPDGSLGKHSDFVQFSGSGPHPTRQKQSYAHAIASDAGDEFVYVCDLGSDKVWSFRFDKQSGSLTATTPQGFGAVPPGSGPRHLAFHPNGRFVYANNEMGLSVTAFAREPATGELTALGTVPTSEKPTGPLDGVTTAEILCHPNGRWLYVSSRGDDLIAVYAIAEDGTLRLIENIPAGVQIPRGMALDPTGRWIVVAGQKDNRVTSLKIDAETGRLTPSGHEAVVPAPVCVVF